MLKRLAPVLALGATCWLVFYVNILFWHGQLNQYGIVPRHVGSLTGIIWAPFLHASLAHITGNTVPLLVLGGIICARSRGEFVMVTVAGILLTGAATWLIGRNGCHIGASGLIFCYFGYLGSMAWFRRTFGSLLLSAVCLFAYGGILRGIVPSSTPVSWEGHIAGLVAGVALAWMASKVNPPPNKTELELPQVRKL